MKKVEKIEYPIRVNRYLYLRGYCSRRAADKLVEQGKIKINGVVAVLGQKVSEKDDVDVADSVKEMPSNYQYYLFNKPIGIVSHNPQKGEKSVEDVSGLGPRVFPVGRLDKESGGLMLLTNDGRIVDKMLNPKFGHEREYEVQVDKRITESALNRMRRGVRIEANVKGGSLHTRDITTKPAKVERLGGKSFSIVLTEGKKHQIRRMASALGYTVHSLKRVRIMNLGLGNLPKGKTRALTQSECAELLQSIGLMIQR